MWPNIVLSGGGLAAIMYFGCLKYISENVDMKRHMKNILGVSSGSIFALLLIFNCDLDDCKKWLDEVKNINFNKINLRSLACLKNEYGLDDSEGIKCAVRQLFDMKGVNHDINFRQISQTYGKNLVICSANVSKKKLFYFSVDTTPDIPIIEAIKASTSIPLLFTPYKLNDEYHVDAFVYDNFPIHYFQNSEQTIGLNLTTEACQNNNCMNLFTNIFNSIIYYNSVKKTDNECLLIGRGSGFDLKKMRFAIDDDSVDEQIEYGYTTLKDFVNFKISQRSEECRL